MMVDAIAQLSALGLNADEARETSELIKEPWYYKVEVAPDLWTSGQRYPNIAITRELLDRVDLSGASLLDIGTMEGVVPIIASAKGAKRVVAYDRLAYCRPRVAALQGIYGYKYEHVTGLTLTEFRAQRPETFDVVVFSGVFYHMFDPFGGLAIASSFVKPGGLLIFESSAVVLPNCALHFNKAGRYFRGTNYFQPTPDALDSFFRFHGLAPLDAEYITRRELPEPLIRIAVACRAKGKPVALEGDTWVMQRFDDDSDDSDDNTDISEFYMNRRNSHADVPDLVKYTACDRPKAIEGYTETLHVARFVEHYPAFEVRPEMMELSLKLRAPNHAEGI
jgi:2-polyprenyl-3-methyl-5-hydroxy-6-metoxy-1,4-benzoquinol methylase